MASSRGSRDISRARSIPPALPVWMSTMTACGVNRCSIVHASRESPAQVTLTPAGKPNRASSLMFSSVDTQSTDRSGALEVSATCLSDVIRRGTPDLLAYLVQEVLVVDAETRFHLLEAVQ